jgi:hypothetical protein
MENGNYGHWDISDVGEFDPAEWFGFIYEIRQRSTGKSYIGKKFFKFKRKKTKADKSRTKPSDWMDYTSSSVLVSDLVTEEGKEAFDFRILRLCSGRCELTYAEMEEQFARNVLRARLPNGERAFFNKTIAYKNFAGVEKQTEETRRKMSEAHRQRGDRPPQHSNEVLSEWAKERWADPEYVAQLKESFPTERRAEVMSQTFSSPENAAKRQQASLENYKKGRLPWWTDGEKNLRSLECPCEGWRRGRTIAWRIRGDR